MQITLKTPDFMVLDDFLPQQDFQYMWSFCEEENYRPIHSDKWIKAFQLSDGPAMWGGAYTSHPAEGDSTAAPVAFPTGRGIDALISKISDSDATFQEYVGSRGIDWNYFFCRPYLYPAGSGLSWHTDGRGDVAGAYVYYAHPKWEADWGAELLIDGSGFRHLDYPERDMYDGTKKRLGLHLDNGPSSEAVMNSGVGNYIMPKPNRFVLLRKGVLHRINRVDSNAGGHPRASITGFFLNR